MVNSATDSFSILSISTSNQEKAVVASKKNWDWDRNFPQDIKGIVIKFLTIYEYHRVKFVSKSWHLAYQQKIYKNIIIEKKIPEFLKSKPTRLVSVISDYKNARFIRVEDYGILFKINRILFTSFDQCHWKLQLIGPTQSRISNSDSHVLSFMDIDKKSFKSLSIEDYRFIVDVPLPENAVCCCSFIHKSKDLGNTHQLLVIISDGTILSYNITSYPYKVEVFTKLNVENFIVKQSNIYGDFLYVRSQDPNSSLSKLQIINLHTKEEVFHLKREIVEFGDQVMVLKTGVRASNQQPIFYYYLYDLTDPNRIISEKLTNSKTKANGASDSWIWFLVDPSGGSESKFVYKFGGKTVTWPIEQNAYVNCDMDLAFFGRNTLSILDLRTRKLLLDKKVIGGLVQILDISFKKSDLFILGKFSLHGRLETSLIKLSLNQPDTIIPQKVSSLKDEIPLAMPYRGYFGFIAYSLEFLERIQKTVQQHLPQSAPHEEESDEIYFV